MLKSGTKLLVKYCQVGVSYHSDNVLQYDVNKAATLNQMGRL